jgi:antitoxin HicB
MRTKFQPDAYPFTIQPLSAEDGGGYLIEFPDVPGCISDGETPEQAILNGRDALKSCLQTMREFGDAIPEHGTLARSKGSEKPAVRRHR